MLFMVGSIALIQVDGNEPTGEGGYFGSDLIYNSTRSLSGGMGAADLDGDGEIEVAFCDFSGNVVMLEPQAGGGFRAFPIWEEEGPQGTDKGLFDLVIADVLDGNDGPEILVGGFSGNLYAIYRQGDLWTHDVIYTTPMYDDTTRIRIFEIEVADVDPAPGDEILLGSMINDQIGPDRYLRYLYRSGSEWLSTEIEVLDTVKAIDVGDADASLEGDEIYITTSGWNERGGTDSSLVQLHRNGSSWDQRSIYRNSDALIANVRVGEFWSGHSGNELITAGLSGWCRVFSEVDGNFVRKDVFQAKTTAGESSAIEGLAIGDFNPTHEGDEAMVTGYYNIVTQVYESEGEVIGETAWKTDAEDIRLEFAGVEVADVSDEHQGNEVLVANLAGWIEMLYYQGDGLDLVLPAGTIEVDAGSSGRFDIELVPMGSVEGDVVIDITGGDLVDVIFDRFQTLERGSVLKVPVVLDPLSGEERTFRLNVTITAGELVRYGEVTVRVVPEGGGFSIIINPSTAKLYDMGGNTFISTVSLAGAEGYDQIELEASEVNGLTVMVDTPIRPGDEKNMIVQAHTGFRGTRVVTVTGYYNDAVISQATLTVEVLSLSENLDYQLRKNESGRYSLRVYLNGSAPVKGLSVEVNLDDTQINRYNIDMQAGTHIDLSLPLEKGDKGRLSVNISNIAGKEIENVFIQEVDLEEDEETSTGWEILAGLIIIIIAITIVVVLFIFTKPKKEQDASIEGIGGSRKYDYRTRPVRSGKIPERRPPPRRPPGGGPRF
jgi:hypothetical protein